MSDLLVKLYPLPKDDALLVSLREKGIAIKKALPPDRNRVIEFLKAECGSENWESEICVAFAREPMGCWIAVKEKKVVGFGCFDATAPGFFGPTLVAKSERRQGIGKALLLKCLESMREKGYGYAIIGWAAENAVHFYEQACGAMRIPGEGMGIFSRMLGFDEE